MDMLSGGTLIQGGLIQDLAEALYREAVRTSLVAVPVEKARGSPRSG